MLLEQRCDDGRLVDMVAFVRFLTRDEMVRNDLLIESSIWAVCLTEVNGPEDIGDSVIKYLDTDRPRVFSMPDERPAPWNRGMLWYRIDVIHTRNLNGGPVFDMMVARHWRERGGLRALEVL